MSIPMDLDYEQLLSWLGIASLVTFVGSLLVLPWLIARLPADYFIRHRERVEQRHQRHPLVAHVIFFTRNFSGTILVLAGVAMLLLPGQGILTMVIGILCMDFPGKQHFVDRVFGSPRIMRALNFVRKRERRPPFLS